MLVNIKGIQKFIMNPQGLEAYFEALRSHLNRILAGRDEAPWESALDYESGFTYVVHDRVVEAYNAFLNELDTADKSLLCVEDFVLAESVASYFEHIQEQAEVYRAFRELPEVVKQALYALVEVLYPYEDSTEDLISCDATSYVMVFSLREYNSRAIQRGFHIKGMNAEILHIAQNLSAMLIK